MSTDKGAAVAKGTAQKLEEILDRLDRQERDAATGPAAASAAKKTRRCQFRRSNVFVSVEQPGGGPATRVAAHTRSLWCEGTCFLWPRFTYSGSTCAVTLVTNDKESVTLPGVITNCRHVEGALHEVEVKFKQSVDPLSFTEPTRTGAVDSQGSVELSNLHGKILHLDDSELDHKLLAHHLRGSGIELTAVKTAAEAVAALKKSMFDIFLTDLNLGSGGSGVDAVKAARAAGFSGPIVLLTAENSQGKLAVAKSAGTDHFLAKPYQRNTLVQLMIQLHKAVGAVTSGDALYSTLEDQSEVEEFLAGYVLESKQIALRIQAGIVAHDLEAVRELCLNVKGTAVGYGFGPLGLAAEEALRALDGTSSLEESRPQLRMLTLMCGQLGIRRSAA
jgi:CheY-like chemotaxis protein